MINHKELKIGEQGTPVGAKIYSDTASFPKEEVYGLASLLIRSARFVQ